MYLCLCIVFGDIMLHRVRCGLLCHTYLLHLICCWFCLYLIYNNIFFRKLYREVGRWWILWIVTAYISLHVGEGLISFFFSRIVKLVGSSPKLEMLVKWSWKGNQTVTIWTIVCFRCLERLFECCGEKDTFLAGRAFHCPFCQSFSKYCKQVVILD